MKERWSNASVALHWLAAALIVGLATAGFVMTDLPADSSGRLLISRLHTLGGATLMLLTVARFVVRRRGPAVSPLPVSDLHRRGVGVIHALLYVVTFGIGATGFVTGARSAWPDYLRGQLAGQALDEARVLLHRLGEVGRVVDEVLRDRVDLHALRRELDPDRLHPGELRAARRRVGRGALHAAQRRGAAEDQDLAVAARHHRRRERLQEAGQRIDQPGEGLAPLRRADLERGRARRRDREVQHQRVDLAMHCREPRRQVRVGRRLGRAEHRGAAGGEAGADRRAHEVRGLGDEDPPACEAGQVGRGGRRGHRARLRGGDEPRL